MEIVVERCKGIISNLRCSALHHEISYGAPHHPTVDEIYTALSPTIPTLSKTTVYNTLKILSEQGAAQTLTIDERNTCYDADTTPHAHFLCKRCGKVYDLTCNDTVRQVVDTDMDGHEVQEIHYYYKGICKQCKED